MAPRLHLALLWHMHQPFYYDWEKGRLSLPWVRLHAVRAYHDMPRLVEDSPGARGNFNLVPSLLRQVLLYGEGVGDLFLELSRRPAEELSPEEREFVLRHFFSANRETMIRPHPRYHQLLVKRGEEGRDLAAVAGEFSPQELRDLQVWFNLAWTGFSLRDHPLVAGLRRKGRDFSEEEKNALLDLHLEVLGEIVPLYRRLAAEGRIELSTTPFYHPILPLLLDTEFARRNLPGAKLPPRFSHPEDARSQIEAALDLHARLFGQRPRGMWPAEGSVCPEMIPLVAEAGLKWLATDEEILYRSLGASGPGVLLAPYLAEHGGGEVAFVFRHHGLSDRIGFVYRGLSPQEAVADLLGTARRLARESGLRDPFLVLILDGENPWEHYPDGGEGFLRTLYREIDRSDDLELVTIGDYLEAHPPKRRLADLYTGSWINANFDIWIGHEEENRAWSLLGRTREALGDLAAAPKEAREAMLAAEGSDWFWWFGDHFSTPFALEFDRLFRGHLRQVFRALGKTPPAALSAPVRRPRRVEPLEPPTAFIHPVIDGRESHYFEWAGAGRYEPDSLGEAMYLGESFLEGLWFGFDLEHLYLKLDLRRAIREDEGRDRGVKIVLEGESHRAEVSFSLAPEGIQESLTLVRGDRRWQGPEAGQVAMARVVELRLPFARLGFGVGEKVSFHLELLEEGVPRERFPRAGELSFTVPDENFEGMMWQA